MPYRSKKSGTKLQTNGEDEKEEAELLHKMQCVLIDWITEVANDNSGEENAGCAESDAAKLQTAKRHAEHADKSERADRVGDRLCFVQFEKPAHGANSTSESASCG